MCGISVIISGIRIDLSSLLPDIDSHVTEAQPQLLSVDDLKVALRRRGPDSVGGKKVVLYSNTSVSVEGHKIFSFIEGEEENKREKHVLVTCKNRSGCLSANGEFREQNNFYVVPKSVVELHFIGATLQLRGINPIFQPLVDNFGNILIYNGEIFGGIHVGSDNNDAEILLKSLGECCSCNRHVDDKKSHSCDSIGGISVPEVFSSIKGPWAAIYWQVSLFEWTVQEHCGLVEMHLGGGASLCIGQIQKILDFYYLL